MIPSHVMSDRASIHPALAYLDAARDLLEHIRDTQMGALDQAATICTDSIAAEGLVHMFGTGHSRIMLEEMFPRHGSFPGFHPIVELSLTYHNAIVGANGQRQAMYLEHVEGFGNTILRNFVLEPPDSFLIVSNSGVNVVVVEVALEARRLGLPVIALVSLAHSRASTPKHPSGFRLEDIADVTLDNGAPGGDALVSIDGLEDPVGPGSTVGGALMINALKCLVAARLTRRGMPPVVLSSSLVLGDERSKQRFDRCYDDYRRRMRRALGCGREGADRHALSGDEDG
jgi:uncharacterized phosphosugar-binding protein